MTRPVSPSTITGASSLSFPITPTRPATAGMLSERAMIVVCEVRPPVSMAKPITRSRPSRMASDGVRSSATMTMSDGSSRSWWEIPWRLRSRWRLTSVRSSLRSRM